MFQGLAQEKLWYIIDYNSYNQKSYFKKESER